MAASTAKEKPVVQQVATALKAAAGQPFEFGASRIMQRGNVVYVEALEPSETTDENGATSDDDTNP